MKKLFLLGTNGEAAPEGIQALNWDEDSCRFEKIAGGGPPGTSHLTQYQGIVSVL